MKRFKRSIRKSVAVTVTALSVLSSYNASAFAATTAGSADTTGNSNVASNTVVNNNDPGLPVFTNPSGNPVVPARASSL
ncbi:hypothetical protein [Paenibacillus hexagrammi]|uniref:Uncharacterized protein n=1 Tax=Paenibacillus hexagrammi TaxID=2908839 RepID=A0ABY3SNE8_9BACL|nr:hypothetical protein [Paenibacillus sp. YPD9-1]UJF35474.1 hypothetical protein L0M14_10435 [Paenibacillus sp. YPD9-1]